MGWLGVAFVGPLLAVPPAWVILWLQPLSSRQRIAYKRLVAAVLLIGGLLYTFGAVVYITKIFNFVPGSFGFHEIWHIFVFIGYNCCPQGRGLRTSGRKPLYCGSSFCGCVGRGKMIFRSILGALYGSVYQGYVFGEFIPKPDADTAARKNIEYLRSLDFSV
jgi:hypothetical protein